MLFNPANALTCTYSRFTVICQLDWQQKLLKYVHLCSLIKINQSFLRKTLSLCDIKWEIYCCIRWHHPKPSIVNPGHFLILLTIYIWSISVVIMFSMKKCIDWINKLYLLLQLFDWMCAYANPHTHTHTPASTQCFHCTGQGRVSGTP